VAFRGTEANPVDWITDARFNPVAGAFGAPVHSGFKVALDEVWDDVAGLAGRPLSLFFTGHSLGAALATLGAARWAESGGNVAGVFTFGQPRTGQTAFVSAYNAKLADVTYRFVNHIDLVTRVPLWVQRYRHVGRRMYWDGSGRFHGDASWWQVAKDDIAYRFAHFGRIQSIGLEPHFVPAYSKLVDELQ
jgi:triacylglycerol lipase